VVRASARGLPQRPRPPIAGDPGQPAGGDAPSGLPGLAPALVADGEPGGPPAAGGRSPAAGRDPRWRLSALTVAWLGLACVALAGSPVRLVDAVTCLTLLALAALAALLTRPADAGGWPERVRCLTVVWTLPVSVLLPPVYALLVHLPLCLLPDSRPAAVRAPWVASVAVRGPLGRWVSAGETVAGEWSPARGRAGRAGRARPVHDAFALGLAGLAANWLHRLVAGTPGPYTVDGLAGSPPRLAALAAAAAGYALVRWLLMPSTAHALPWRCESVTPAWGRAPRLGTALTRTAELCGAVAVAVLWAANPLLMLAVVPPVLLLVRSLPPEELLAAARTDAKTGLANVTFWREVADAELARARRAGRPLSVLLVDIDHFKQVNDQHGHLFGDTVLVAVADALRAATRPWDLVGRFGGEEFVVLLAEVDLATAAEIAERIRGQVAAIRCPLDLAGPEGGAVSVTVSVGAAVCAPAAGLPDALEAADAALYRAKAEGRDRVRLAGMVAPEAAPDRLGHPEALGHPAVPAQAVQPD
jgi:diguanylate cyclase (GGDEF)-like protein